MKKISCIVLVSLQCCVMVLLMSCSTNPGSQVPAMHFLRVTRNSSVGSNHFPAFSRNIDDSECYWLPADQHKPVHRSSDKRGILVAFRANSGRPKVGTVSTAIFHLKQFLKVVPNVTE
jgi:hypothetical protein